MPRNGALYSVFRVSNEPLVITKGHYGYSYFVEISFSHETLLPWLEQLKGPLPLLLLDADWIQRSPNELRFIKEKQFPVGLLGQNGATYENSKTLEKDIAIFEQAFSSKPLWYTTRDYVFTKDMQQFLFANEINIVAPTVLWGSQKNLQLTEGSIISIPFHEETTVQLKEINSVLSKYSFISIEENIFGYTIKNKTFP